jgi:AcrR family transcriptional regulator
MASEDTRERLLNAAEQLFAERGISGTTVRALSKAAKVNLAAVHYHFGGKEGLLDAVVERRAAAMNRERLRELEQLERSAGPVGEGASSPGALQVEEILRAFFLSGLRAFEREEPETIDRLTRLSARITCEPPEAIEALVRKHFGTVMKRFVEALQAALPGLRNEVVDDRFRFVIGTLSHVFSGTFDLDVIPGHAVCDTSDEDRIQHLIVFLAAGLRAPNPPPTSLGASSAVFLRSGGIRRRAGRREGEGMEIRKEARR